MTTLDREPVLVDPSVVRQTNGASVRRPWSLPDTPIVVTAVGLFLYIVDGNHRFVADVKLGRPVKAWVLTAKDRKKLRGTLTGSLRAWTEGLNTFADLKRSSVEAYNVLTVSGERQKGQTT